MKFSIVNFALKYSLLSLEFFLHLQNKVINEISISLNLKIISFPLIKIIEF